MDEEIATALRLIQEARTAWDQYNIQLSLPDEPAWIVQGHPWDQYNNGRRAPQARRDPIAIGRAWNRLERSLGELGDVAERVRGRAPTPALPPIAVLDDDRRVGPFSPAPRSSRDPQGRGESPGGRAA